MPSRARLDQFIAAVESNDHAGAIERYYTEDASMQENAAPPRVGRDVLVAHERAVLNRSTIFDAVGRLIESGSDGFAILSVRMRGLRELGLRFGVERGEQALNSSGERNAFGELLHASDRRALC